MAGNTVMTSNAIVFKKAQNGRLYWLVVKQNEGSEWEIPRIMVRKGESSVRAALRMMGEQGGMTTRVIEEAGRSGGSTSINGKVVPKRDLYYLLICKAESEALGFYEYKWHDYAKTRRLLKSKTDKQMLTGARKEFLLWRKKRKSKKQN